MSSFVMMMSLTLLLAYQSVNAEEFVIESGREEEGCNSIGGKWIDTDTICYTVDLTIDVDDTLILEDSGYLVVFTGTTENNGQLFINYIDSAILFAGEFNNNKGALFENYGIPSNEIGIPRHPDYEIQIGTINNYGTIDNYGGITMDRPRQDVENDFDDYIIIENHGTINNYSFFGASTGTIINNHGKITNERDFLLSTLNNNVGATFQNSEEGMTEITRELNNKGTIINNGESSFEDPFCSGTINNFGTIIGNSLTSERCDSSKNTINDSNEMSNSEQENDKEGGGCLIATAAYGTELAPQIQFLREIRDNTVINTASGAAFMTGFNQFYYSFSPAVADLERGNPIIREMIRVFITPMISTLSIMTLAENDSEAEVLGLGISVIALNLGIYVATPAIVGFAVSKRIKLQK